MTNAELIATIRNEIERRITDNTFGAKLELIDILAWLDTLEPEKPVPNDLEEEAENIYKTPFGTRAEDFKAGAEWQYEQMMKDGDEGIVRKVGTIGYIAFTDEQQFNSRLEQFQDMDKVRIIIVKE